MIAANYTMHIYCDCVNCMNFKSKPKSDEFIGQNWRDVSKQAKREGWKISKDRCFASSATAPLNQWEMTINRVIRFIPAMGKETVLHLLIDFEVERRRLRNAQISMGEKKNDSL